MAKMHVREFDDRQAAEAHYLDEANRMVNKVREPMNLAHEFKHTEAYHWINGPEMPSPFLEAEAEEIGVTVDELATRVMDKHAKWEARDARLEAKRIGARAEIRSCSTPAEMAKVVSRLRDTLGIDGTMAAD